MNLGVILGVVALIVALGGVGGVWAHYGGRAKLAEGALDGARKAAQDARDALTTCRSEVGGLRVSYAEQGKALTRQAEEVKGLQRERDDGLKRWKEEARRAEAERAAAGRRIGDLMSRVSPKERAEQCAALDALRAEHVAGQIR